MKATRTSPGWGVRCVCGRWLTKWDFSPEDALAVAAAASCSSCGESPDAGPVEEWIVRFP